MPGGRQIVVEIVGDSSKFTKATGEAVTGSTSLTGKLQGIGKGMVIGAGIGAFNLLTAGVGLAISKLDEAHQAFLDDQVSSDKLANSLKNNIPGWDGNTTGAEAFATAAESMGFADDEARDSIGQLVGVTHNLEEAQQLSSLAMDLARAKGIDLAQATDIVTKAHEGNGKALKGLGIDIAGAKTGADLLAAAQKNVEGAAASWANTNQGKLAVSNQKVQEAMEKVGGIIDKVSQVVIPIFADVLTGVIDILGQVVQAITPVVTAIAQKLEPVFKAVGPVATAIFTSIGVAVKALAPVFNTVFGIIGGIIKVAEGVFNAYLGVMRTVFGAVGTVVGVFVNVLQTEFRIVGTVLGILQSAFNTAATFIGKVFSSIGGVVRGAINSVIGAVNGVIGAINSISLHIHLNPPVGPSIGFDWNGPNLGKIPYLHAGGVVPGQAGADVLAVLQAGEVVTPAGGGPGGAAYFDFRGAMIYGGPSGLDELAAEVAGRLRLQGVTRS